MVEHGTFEHPYSRNSGSHPALIFYAEYPTPRCTDVDLTNQNAGLLCVADGASLGGPSAIGKSSAGGTQIKIPN
jgi:hypothetical protein